MPGELYLCGAYRKFGLLTLGDTDTPSEASVHRLQVERLRDLLKAEYPTLGFNCLLLSNVPHEYKATRDKLPALEIGVLI